MGYFSSGLNVGVRLDLLGQYVPLGMAVPLANASAPNPQIAIGGDPAWGLKCWQAWQRCESRNPNDKRWVKSCSDSLQQCLQTPGIATIFPGGISVR